MENTSPNQHPEGCRCMGCTGMSMYHAHPRWIRCLAAIAVLLIVFCLGVHVGKFHHSFPRHGQSRGYENSMMRNSQDDGGYFLYQTDRNTDFPMSPKMMQFGQRYGNQEYGSQGYGNMMVRPGSGMMPGITSLPQPPKEPVTPETSPEQK